MTVTDHPAIGTRAVFISPQRLTWAVHQLSGLGVDRLSHLKIASGEHLAALLLTSFLEAPPAELDTQGGVDFLFRLESDRLLDGMPPGGLAAFEIKSVPGNFRQASASIDWKIKRGENPVGTRFGPVVVEHAADILHSTWPIATRIADLLRVKTPERATRNGFLIIHPFERMALEAIEEPIISPYLPPVPPAIDLDTLWTLWFPNHLAMWSRALGRWTELIFSADDPRYHEEPDLDVLQQISLDLLAAIGYSGNDPYVFGLHVRKS